MVLDDQQMTGVNRWLKPAKFAASIGLYLLTMAWLLHELRSSRWILATLSAVMLCSMTGEQLLITMQAFRGVTSHYTIATTFDASAATHGRRSGDSSRHGATSCGVAEQAITARCQPQRVVMRRHVADLDDASIRAMRS